MRRNTLVTCLFSLEECLVASRAKLRVCLRHLYKDDTCCLLRPLTELSFLKYTFHIPIYAEMLI